MIFRVVYSSISPCVVSLEGTKGLTIEIPAFQMFRGGNSTFSKKDVILKIRGGIFCCAHYK